MKVETYKINDWEELETGLLIDENENWILVKHIPVDYIIDGFKIYNKEFVGERIHSDTEQRIEKVLKLKTVQDIKPNNFEFFETIGLLKWVENNYGLFEFQDDDASEVIYGKMNRIEHKNLIIDMIHSDGSVEENYNYEFDIDEIRVITFESDYHQSIGLLWKDWLKN